MALVKRGTNPAVTNRLEDLFTGGLFEDLFPTSGSIYLPAVNVSEDNNNYKIEVAAPGLNKDDFNVDLSDNVLTISSEKEEEKKDENYNRREFSYTSFQRSFTLPEYADENNISANYQNGVLYVNIPKKEEAKKQEKKKIEIS